MNYISGLYDIVATGCDRYREMNDPQIVRAKEELQVIRQGAGLFALATFVASVALSALGILSGISAIRNMLFFISLPAAYFSYNIYRVCENAYDIIDTPMKYQMPLTNQINTVKVRAQLIKDTFFFEPVLDIGFQIYRGNFFE